MRLKTVKWHHFRVTSATVLKPIPRTDLFLFLQGYNWGKRWVCWEATANQLANFLRARSSVAAWLNTSSATPESVAALIFGTLKNPSLKAAAGEAGETAGSLAAKFWKAHGGTATPHRDFMYGFTEGVLTIARATIPVMSHE
jgi:hypothetical protein